MSRLLQIWSKSMKLYLFSLKNHQRTLIMHSEHFQSMSDDFKHELVVKIHVRSTILLSVTNLSQNCPESMKSNENQLNPLIVNALHVLCLCIFFRAEIFNFFQFGQKIVSRNCVYYVLKYVPGYSCIPKFFHIGSYCMTSVNRSIKGM